jgi:hypothetical protein
MYAALREVMAAKAAARETPPLAGPRHNLQVAS